MTPLKLTILAVPRILYVSSVRPSCRNIHMPCKTAGDKTVSWSSSSINITKKQITENIKFVSAHQGSSLPQDEAKKPLAVILQWLMAKNKHVWKFIDIYIKYGFDVLAVKLKTSQLIWPVTGSQPVAGDLLRILSDNFSNRTVVVHGFSVGGYLWGEVQLKMVEDLEKHQALIKNIAGGIWDSVVDVHETAIGVPAALFPNNAFLRNTCRKYILYHMKAFEKDSTQHWLKSREMFYRPIVKCPALFLYSKTDPIGNVNSYKNVRMSFESLGIQTYEKCWDRSPHVAHYAFHKKEYVDQLETFLEKIGIFDCAINRRAAIV